MRISFIRLAATVAILATGGTLLAQAQQYDTGPANECASKDAQKNFDTRTIEGRSNMRDYNEIVLNAFKHNDYVTAFCISRILAKVGDVMSQYIVGAMYAKGDGTKQNYSKSFQFYLMAAGNYYMPAELATGLNFSKGRGVKQDRIMAYVWLYKAKKQGSHRAGVALDQLVSQMTPFERKYVSEIDLDGAQ